MWQKIKNFFIKTIVLLFDTLFVLQMCIKGDDGGLGLNGFLGFLIWVGLMVLLFCVHPFLSFGAGLVLLLLFSVVLTGSTDFLMSFLYIVGILAALLIGLKLLERSMQKSHERAQKIDSLHKQGIQCCPKCGSTRVHYVQARTNVRTVTADSEYHDGWYQRGDVVTDVQEGYWKCDQCRHTWD